MRVRASLAGRRRILVTGATGFIGSRVASRLAELGHLVVGASRYPSPGAGMHIDFGTATTPGAWRPLLEGIDVVVNAVGIFRERGEQTFEALHVRAPRALFDACLDCGVRRVIQISALGVEDLRTAYQRSKHAADAYLQSLPLHSTIVRPSLVFGVQGESSLGMLTLAALPLLVLPEGGRYLVQPVHVDDVVEAICKLVEADTAGRSTAIVPLVGPREITLRDYLQALRHGLGLGNAVIIASPRPLSDRAARLAALRQGSLLDPAALSMLRHGNTASPGAIQALLGRDPRAVDRFLDREPVRALRTAARLGWLVPALRLSLAVVWIVTAALSLGIFPRNESLDLLERTGVPSAWQPLMLYGAALFDLLLGAVTLWPPRQPRQRVWLWIIQVTLMAVYMAIIALRLPEFWLHPFGPLLKNIPILAILLLLIVLDHDNSMAARRDGYQVR